MNTITGGNGPSCSGCVTNVGIRPALVEISTMRSFIALHLVPPRSMLELAEQQLAGHFPVRLGHKITPISREERVAFAVQAAACFAGIRPRCSRGKVRSERPRSGSLARLFGLRTPAKLTAAIWR